MAETVISPTICESKIEQWRQFSKIVELHIENYAIKQYGDFPDKTIAKYTPTKIQGKLEAYVDRIGNNVREGEELLGPKKIAHFCAMLFALQVTGSAQGDLQQILDELILLNNMIKENRDNG